MESMPHRQVEHTADLCFEVTGDTYGELIAESLQAMTAWTGPAWGASGAARPFSVEAADPAMLLVDLLNEALALSEIHREAYDRIEFSALGATFAEGRLLGRSVTGARDEIKAVTYHGAEARRQADGTWKAVILMDI